MAIQRTAGSSVEWGMLGLSVVWNVGRGVEWHMSHERHVGHDAGSPPEIVQVPTLEPSVRLVLHMGYTGHMLISHNPNPRRGTRTNTMYTNRNRNWVMYWNMLNS
jgi:hypothetical protein